MTSRRTLAPLFAVTLAALVACQPADDAADAPSDTAAAAEGGDAVTVVAKDFEFEAPRTVASGWNDFRFVNESDEQEHFFLLWKLPEDVTFADYKRDVTEVFSEVWSRYDAGELTAQETIEQLGEQLPEWYFTDIEAYGGAALTEPGRASEVTLRLDPGTYAMECYVKTPQGTWHTDRGMVRELTVSTDSTGEAAPEADVEMTLSNFEIAVSDSFRAGPQTVAVHVTATPEGLMPHDINLFRIESDTTTVEELVTWMNWMDLKQFRAPAPGIAL
ncbi:MAG: hypothetical protein R3266_12785, partial [Gemmatimonadota bacterium]|nr:hypothetical protein [Gemmatimonadota bacterium]